MTRVRHGLFIAALTSALAGFATAAAAQDAAGFYKGKNVRLIIGSGEGSGVDILARITARHLGKQIPGNPTIVAQNMAQQESIGSANHVYNVAEKDGTFIGAGSSGLFSRAISQPNIRFDLGKMNWVANLYNATVIYWMRTDFPCQTIEQIAKCPQPIKFAATARGSTGYGLVPELLKEALGLKMDIIYGYKGSDTDIAVERGEAHASGGDLIGFLGGSGKRLMEEGKVKILVQVAGKKSPALEPYNVPWVMDVLPAERKNLFLMLNPILDLARPYYAAPGIPAERVAALREAFAKLANDAEFKAEVKKAASIETSFVHGADMQQAIQTMLDQPPEVKDKIISLLTSGNK